jgi:anti-sigma regulatory factor (Ser/Thr protein kinase)
MAVLRLCADCFQLATIGEFVARVGKDLDLDDRTVSDVQLAVDEACTNVIEHGYGGRGGELELRIEPAGSSLKVTLRDWGEAFDPEAIPVPDVQAPLDQRRLGGLGLYLMRELMDEVCFVFDAEQGNTLTMLKRLGGGRRRHWTPTRES